MRVFGLINKAQKKRNKKAKNQDKKIEASQMLRCL